MPVPYDTLEQKAAQGDIYAFGGAPVGPNGPQPTSGSTGLGTGGGKAPAGYEYNGQGQLTPLPFGSNIQPSLPGVTSSSNGVVTAENGVRNTVNSLVPPADTTEGAKTASQKYLDTLDEQSKSLEARLSDSLKSINAGFDVQQAKLQDAQTRETGTYNVALQRIGGYLGDSASSTGTLLNLAKTHRDEVVTLEAKRQAAIQDARNAITDKQFELAKAKAQEAKDIEKTISDRKNKFFDQSIQIQQEQRAKDALAVTQAKEARDSEAYKVESVAPSLLQTISGITDETVKSAYIDKTAANLGVDPNVLRGGLEAYRVKQNEKANAAILDLVKAHPDAGISNADLTNGDINSVISKVTNSQSYKLENMKTKAEIDKLMADAVKARIAANGGASGTAESNLLYYADYAAKNGGQFPPGLPEGQAGVAYALAKERAKELVLNGAIVDSNGFELKNGKMSAATQQAITGTYAIYKQLPEIEKFIDEHNTYPGGGALAEGGKYLSLTSTDRVKFNQMVDDVTSQLALARSGQAVSDAEYTRLRSLLPTLNSYSKYNKVNIEGFRDRLTTQIKTKLDADNATLKGVDLRTSAEIKADAAKAANFDE